MRQTAIPGAVVGALNDLFDKNPHAITALLGYTVPVDAAAAEAHERKEREMRSLANHATERAAAEHPGDGVGMALAMNAAPGYLPTRCGGPRIGLLDVLNAVASALDVDSDIHTVHNSRGDLEGFILGRPRRPVLVPASDPDSADTSDD